MSTYRLGLTVIESISSEISVSCGNRKLQLLDDGLFPPRRTVDIRQEVQSIEPCQRLTNLTLFRF